MDRKTGQGKHGKTGAAREDRLKSALKANLQRRKAQARSRAQMDEPSSASRTKQKG